MSDLERASKKRSKSSKSKVQNMWEYVVQYDARPMNLVLIPGSKGKSCYISEHQGRGPPSSVIYPKSKVLAINDLSMDNQTFENIKMMLMKAPLPLKLHLHSPSIEVDQRSESAKHRRRRRHRPKQRSVGRIKINSAGPGELKLKKATSYTRRGVSPRHDLKLQKTLSLGKMVPHSREPKQKRRSGHSKQRRKSTGSWQMFQDGARESSQVDLENLPNQILGGYRTPSKADTTPHSLGHEIRLAEVQPRPTAKLKPTKKAPSSAYKSAPSPAKKKEAPSSQIKEELDYLKNCLKRIYSALTKPSNEGDEQKEIRIPFNRKFPKHFQMLEVILIQSRIRRAKEPDDPISKYPAESYGEMPRIDLALGSNIDEWVGRIVQELGVDKLNINSRTEECVVSLEAICKLKEDRDMLSNQVKSLEELLKFVRRKSASASTQVEEFKTRVTNIGEGVGKMVVKILGLRDRLGSFSSCLRKVELPRVNRLATELDITPIHKKWSLAGKFGPNSPLKNQLESLTTLLDMMISLVRKSEVVIRDGMIPEQELKGVIEDQNDIKTDDNDKPIDSPQYSEGNDKERESRDKFLE